MGTGANCSYTLENGTFVTQLCSSGALYCCTPSSTSTSSSSSPAPAVVCSENECTTSIPSQLVDNNDISAYTFWLILAGASAFTVIVLLVSYIVCRFRKPGCADASSAQERFLVENVLGAGGRSRSHAALTSTASAATTASSPTSASPDLLLEPPLTRGRQQLGRGQGAGSRTATERTSAVNRAFRMGAEAFSRIPIHVNRGGPAGRTRVAGETDVSMVSPRLVHVGGVTPRVPLKDKGKTESRQTILSVNDDRLTAVGT